METEIIIHNSISLDGSLTGFMPEMELHYKIAGDYKPDARLIGADTVLTGNEMFGDLKGIKSFSLSKSEQFDNGCIWTIYNQCRDAQFGRLRYELHIVCRDAQIGRLYDQNVGNY